MGAKKEINFKLFSDWLDRILEQDLPDDIIAFNFNLYEVVYEGAGRTYDIQLIGADEFDENNSDWACAECFTTDEDVCAIPRTEDIEHWEKGLDYITAMVKKYLDEGKNADILKSVSAIGIGFVDGDLEIIYRK